MIIILEGVDGTGKSTLAKKLSQQLDMPIIKMDKPTDEDQQGSNMFYYYKGLLESRDYVILDRCWYSELVYGSVMPGRTSCITAKQCAILEDLIRDRAIVIHCTASEQEILNVIRTRGDDYITDDFALVLALKERYKMLFKQECRLVQFEYNFHNQKM